MIGIQFTYKNSKGQTVYIKDKEPQYLYLEPKGRVVVRYYFIKDNLDTNNTKLISDILEPDVISVKIKKPFSVFLSTIADFRSIPEREEPAQYFEIDFTESDTVVMDVLYESKVAERLKIKVRNSEAEDESFENENTLTDGPDAYLKVVAVNIGFQDVYYVYVFRRAGRLRKSPGRTSYDELAKILKERMLINPYHLDKVMSIASIIRGLSKDFWSVDYTDKRIFRIQNDKEVDITDAQLGQIIRKYGDVRDILNLLTTLDVNITDHALIREAERALVSCDGDCSLPKAIPQNTIDERDVI